MRACAAHARARGAILRPAAQVLMTMMVVVVGIESMRVVEKVNVET